jgi:long-chain acyl-CoA synthetase
VILYTSGTTSDPKGVVLSHANIVAEGDAVFQVINVTEQDAVLGVLPLFHALAQLANLLLPFWVGARVVFLEQLNTTELLRALRERDCSAFCCVPQFFYLIHDRILKEVGAAGAATRTLFKLALQVNGWLRDRIGLNLWRLVFRRVHAVLGARMRLLLTGGSRFDPAVAGDMRRLGFDILQAYGLTECSGAATVTPPNSWSIDDVGTALPGVSLAIEPRQDDAGAARDGEVLIRGPIVMQGYWNRPDMNAVVLRDGWLRTGDLGFIDGRGRLHITGREKEVIVLSSGKNIHPEELEKHYSRSPFIKEICVLGLAREGEPSAERLHAVVVPNLDAMRERRIVNARELIRFELEGLSVHLPAHKRALGFDVWMQDLPRTTTRKLKRFEIARLLHEQHRRKRGERAAPAAEDTAWTSDPHVASVLAMVRETVPDAPLLRDANLELDLGLDSMERVELLTRLQQHAGIVVSDETAAGLFTLGDVVEALRQGRTGTQAAPDDPWEQVFEQAPASDGYLAGLDRPRPFVAVTMWIGLRLLRGVARVVAGLRVGGVEHLPAQGPYIICPNHESYLDGFLLACALPFRALRSIFFVGATEYFQTRVTSALARLCNIVPVDPDANLVRAMQAGAYGLRKGKVLILFPEGERSIDGEVKAFRKGAALLATRLGVPIVPVAIAGAFEIWPRSRPVNWRGLWPIGRPRLRLRFGPAVAPDELRAVSSGDDGRAADWLRETVISLRRADGTAETS